MPDFSARFDKLIEDLLSEVRTAEDYERQRANLFQKIGNPAFDSQFELINRLIDLQRASKYRVLEELLRYPPFHGGHLTLIDEFHEKKQQNELKPFEKSVFIMTKFPELDATRKPLSSADQQLENVIASVQSAVASNGFCPRVARDREFSPMLWENVELYLLGCSRGIAILESKYKPELNPNVAMEWGWMRGMGKEVFMLVEDKFSYLRADWGALRSIVFLGTLHLPASLGTSRHG